MTQQPTLGMRHSGRLLLPERSSVAGAPLALLLEHGRLVGREGRAAGTLGLAWCSNDPQRAVLLLLHRLLLPASINSGGGGAKVRCGLVERR